MPRLRPEPVSGATRLEDGMADKIMVDRRFYVSGDRQMVREPDGIIHEADPNDPDLLTRARRLLERLSEPDMILGCEHGVPLSDPCAACGRATLDAAWAEAEATLPEYYQLALTKKSEVAFLAEAMRSVFGVPQEAVQAMADTPAAALRTLAARLREL